MINKTKIVATIGPSTSSKEMLKKMVHRGVNVCRINFSHSTHAQAKEIINNIKEVFNDPQVIHSKIAETVDHPKLGKIKLVGQAMKLSRTPSKLKTAAPQKGEHTKDILTELGYSDDEINNLKMENAI